MLVRAEGLADTTSRYVVRRIEEHPGILLRTRTEVVALGGTGISNGSTGVTTGTAASRRTTCGTCWSWPGAAPNAGWLERCVVLDDKGFVKTGADLSPDELTAAGWPLARPPHLLETSRPGVFAVGDVRSGNIKRVASAVGE